MHKPPQADLDPYSTLRTLPKKTNSRAGEGLVQVKLEKCVFSNTLTLPHEKMVETFHD